LDIAGDPLNFVGGGAAKALKGAKQLPGAVASLSNYIPDWYSADIIDKTKGLLSWGMDSATSTARHLADPVSRANWAENAVTGPAQDRVAGLADNMGTDSRAAEKGVSQVQYTSSHIPTQTGGKRSTAPSAREIHDRSFLSDYEDYSKEGLANQLREHDTTQLAWGEGKTAPKGGDKRWAEGKKQKLSEADANVVTDVVDDWFDGDIDQYIIKAPGSKETGGHASDVIFNSPAKEALRDVFKEKAKPDGSFDPQEVAQWLRANKKQYNEKLRGPEQTRLERLGSQVKAKVKGEDIPVHRTRDSWDVAKVTDDGVWLKGSMLGSAITEGGIGWAMKIEKDGTVRAFMMDKHDFFEKYGAEKVIPGKVVAVTPAMVNNIKYAFGGRKKSLEAPIRDAEGNIVKEGRKHKKKEHSAPYVYRHPQYEGPKTGYKKLLTDYANITPSDLGIGREMGGMLGEALVGQRLYDNTRGGNNDE
jgi:hypothetical protein